MNESDLMQQHKDYIKSQYSAYFDRWNRWRDDLIAERGSGYGYNPFDYGWTKDDIDKDDFETERYQQIVNLPVLKKIEDVKTWSRFYDSIIFDDFFDEHDELYHNIENDWNKKFPDKPLNFNEINSNLPRWEGSDDNWGGLMEKSVIHANNIGFNEDIPAYDSSIGSFLKRQGFNGPLVDPGYSYTNFLKDTGISSLFEKAESYISNSLNSKRTE